MVKSRNSVVKSWNSVVKSRNSVVKSRNFVQVQALIITDLLITFILKVKYGGLDSLNGFPFDCQQP